LRFVQFELEVDDGEEKREKPIQAQIDRFAPIVVLNQLLSKLVDNDDPEKPGKEKAITHNKGSETK